MNNVYLSKKYLLAFFIIAIMPVSFIAHSKVLDTATAEVSVNIGVYASITELDDFVLSPVSGVDGEKGTIYSGSDEYRLKSNGNVRVTLEAASLANENNEIIDVEYSLDNKGLSYEVASNETHDDVHKISATVELKESFEQKAGNYKGSLTLTVSAL